MANEVRDAVGQAERDPAVVGIVLTGAGKGFCAGADMKGSRRCPAPTAAAGATPDEAAPFAERRRPKPGDASWGDDLRGTYTYLLSVPKPIVAAINGAGRRDGRADRPVVRPAVHERGHGADDVVRPARPGRRVGPVVAARPGSSARPTPSTCCTRRARSTATRPPASGSSTGRCRPTRCCRPPRTTSATSPASSSPASMAVMKRQVYTRAARRARRGRTQRHRADAGELRAARLRRGRGVLPRAPRPGVPRCVG